MTYIALTIITIGCVIRLTAIYTLKEKFTFNLVPQDYIVKSGIYKRIRHPSYLGSLLMFFGVGLLSELAVIMLLAYAFFQARIAEEEEILSRNPDYKIYKTKTGQLLPRIKK